MAYLTQTTLSLDEARDIIHALKIKFPNIVGPHSQDICYATENRQVAVRNVAHNAGLVLVVGSTNSSNSNRLVEVSRNLGTVGYLIDNSQAIDPKWLEGVSTVAVTAGASAPEILVEDVVNYLRQNGFSSVEEVEVMPENVRFGLPPEIIQAIGKRAAGSQFPFDSFAVPLLPHSGFALCLAGILAAFGFEGSAGCSGKPSLATIFLRLGFRGKQVAMFQEQFIVLGS